MLACRMPRFSGPATLVPGRRYYESPPGESFLRPMLPNVPAVLLAADQRRLAKSDCEPGGRKEFEMYEIVREAGRTRGRRPRVAVRAVSPGDEDLLRRMFSRLSQRSIYRRFHMPYPRVPEWAVSLFTNVGGYQ